MIGALSSLPPGPSSSRSPTPFSAEPSPETGGTAQYDRKGGRVRASSSHRFTGGWPRTALMYSAERGEDAVGTRNEVSRTMAGAYIASTAPNRPKRNGPRSFLRSRASSHRVSISEASASASAVAGGGSGRKQRLNDMLSRSLAK